MIKRLYDHPEVYSRIFPCDREDVAFFTALAAQSGGSLPILDAASGTGELAERLTGSGRLVATLDRETKLMRAHTRSIRGDLFHLPFASESFGFVYSRLFGYAYAAGERSDRIELLADELARVLGKSARFAIELPVARSPRKLQGIQENSSIEGGLAYSFRYNDIIAETKFGVVFHTEIEVVKGGIAYEANAPLHVFSPEGARAWFSAAGLTVDHFFACYDLRSATMVPPDDCLRAVVAGYLAGIGGGGAVLPSTV